MPGLIGTGQAYHEMATKLGDRAVRAEQNLEEEKKMAEAAHKQQQLSLAGTGAGVGFMAGSSGAAAGSWGGPIGALIGFGVGYLAGGVL